MVDYNSLDLGFGFALILCLFALIIVLPMLVINWLSEYIGIELSAVVVLGSLSIFTLLLPEQKQ